MDKHNYNHSWDAAFHPQHTDTDTFFSHVNVLKTPFTDQHQQWNPANAWFISECTRLCYLEDETQRQAVATAAGLQTCAVADCGDVYAVLWFHAASEQYILAFRGTCEFKNWIANIDAAPCQWPHPGRIHSGFFESFCRCWKMLRGAIDYQQHKIICCGHSLGAAMAAIATIYTQASSLYTIGCPRIGNSEFCELFTDISSHRICNSLDIVTHLPPQSKRFGYTHIGEAIWLGEKERKRDRFKERIQHPSKWFASAKHISDHAPINYSLRLSELALADEGSR